MSNSPKIPTPLTALPPVVSPADWEKAAAALLVKEKAHTDASDALAAERRRMPMVAITKNYVFTGSEGEIGLPELFAGRRQLVVYHHMLKPADDAPCPGCCMFTDMVGHLAHLNARDTTLVLVAHAPIDEITPFKKRMGWDDIPWYSTSDSFNPDFWQSGRKPWVEHFLAGFRQDLSHLFQYRARR